MNAAGPVCVAEKSLVVKTRPKSPVGGPRRKVMALSLPPTDPLPLLTVTVAARDEAVPINRSVPRARVADLVTVSRISERQLCSF
jgi:hypothetical protein